MDLIERWTEKAQYGVHVLFLNHVSLCGEGPPRSRLTLCRQELSTPLHFHTFVIPFNYTLTSVNNVYL
jgi:hypothetical protein